MAKILVVDDSPSEMAKFRDILTRHQYEVIEAHTGDDGIQKANEFFPDVILMASKQPANLPVTQKPVISLSSSSVLKIKKLTAYGASAKAHEII